MSSKPITKPNRPSGSHHKVLLPSDIQLRNIVKKILPTDYEIDDDTLHLIRLCYKDFVCYVAGEASSCAVIDGRPNSMVTANDILNAFDNLGMEQYASVMYMYLLKYKAQYDYMESSNQSNIIPTSIPNNVKMQSALLPPSLYSKVKPAVPQSVPIEYSIPPQVMNKLNLNNTGLGAGVGLVPSKSGPITSIPNTQSLKQSYPPRFMPPNMPVTLKSNPQITSNSLSGNIKPITTSISNNCNNSNSSNNNTVIGKQSASQPSSSSSAAATTTTTLSSIHPYSHVVSSSPK